MYASVILPSEKSISEYLKKLTNDNNFHTIHYLYMEVHLKRSDLPQL